MRWKFWQTETPCRSCPYLDDKFSALVLEDVYSFLDNASVGLHCVGSDGMIHWANSTELRKLGYAAENYIGKHIAEFHA
ncbi:MAG: PAS domain-containing protein, partial [Candidatus Thorarchaeota archaeon]